MTAAMAYRPKPGTTAYRALAWLETQPEDHEVKTAAWAEAIGVPGMILRGSIEAAYHHGLIVGRQLDPSPRSPMYWKLAPAWRRLREREAGEDCDAPAPPAAAPMGAGQAADAAPTGDAPPAIAGNRCKLTECQGKPRCGPCMAMDRSYGPGDGTLRTQACRQADREMLATPAGAELIEKVVDAMRLEDAEQPHDAEPPPVVKSPADFRVALWSNGCLQINRGDGDLMLLTREETRELVRYLDAIARDSVVAA